ncbi:MAG: vWA domain-containing protein [Acidimicrobiales bacterium]
MLDVLAGLVGELRRRGLAVSATEHIDAVRTLTEVDLVDRDALRCALALSLAKSADHLEVFERAFDMYFTPSAAGQVGETPEMSAEVTPRSAAAATLPDPMSREDLGRALEEVLRDDDAATLAVVVREALSRYVAIGSGRAPGVSYCLYQTLRGLELEARVDRVIAEHQKQMGERDALWRGVFAEEVRSRAQRVRSALDVSIRKLLAARKGAQEAARQDRVVLPQDIEIMHASSQELASLEKALRPLGRKLAARLARRRRRRLRGPLDFRATVRRSLSFGGVPLEPRFRRPSPAKPEIMVIADVSGSVASFARFTLHLVYAIAEQFAKVRSFVFVDDLDEVTATLQGAADPWALASEIGTQARVLGVHGHSDYGRALSSFWARFGDQITSRTSVLILGDGRANYHDPRPEVLAGLASKARHLYWLNPEPKEHWGSGDSVIHLYGPHCDSVVECRTLRQVERFVGRLP